VIPLRLDSLLLLLGTGGGGAGGGGSGAARPLHFGQPHGAGAQQQLGGYGG
jgi:hypothetical protein